MGVADGKGMAMTTPDSHERSGTSSGPLSPAGAGGSGAGGAGWGGAAGGGGGAGAAGHSAGHAGAALFSTYKPGQGSYVRWGTAAGGGLVALAFAAFLSDELTIVTQNEYVQYLVPVIGMLALGIVLFRLVGQNKRVVDFLIATEGEMKKVNWSSRREIIGATKVVIFTMLAIGLILFVVDVFFIYFFDLIGVLRIGLLQRMFGGGGGE